MPYEQNARGRSRVEEMINRYHAYHNLGANQCRSVMVQPVAAPLAVVWSLVRRFDNPQAYKQFVRSCTVRAGNGRTAGSVREVRVVSGLPAAASIERLDMLDDECRLMVFSIVGGDHRLNNYRSTLTVHESGGGDGRCGECVVIESYVVDVPPGSTKEETCVFADTIVRCNLTSLARVAEGRASSSSPSSSSTLH